MVITWEVVDITIIMTTFQTTTLKRMCTVDQAGYITDNEGEYTETIGRFNPGNFYSIQNYVGWFEKVLKETKFSSGLDAIRKY